MSARVWKVLPFEVVRRGGYYTVRATGLAKVFPEAFEETPTGDYFKGCLALGIGAAKEPRKAADVAMEFGLFVKEKTSCRNWSIKKPQNVHVARQDWQFRGMP